jgi:filamentous hemagglutinin family protein
MSMRRFVLASLASGALVLASASAAAAQDDEGVASAGAQLLQFVTGSRAAAFSGAYTAAENDADVLFYNPAGIASFGSGASVAYGRFVQDIAITSAAGALKLGPVSIGAAGAFLDAGEVAVVIPDPQFGGERGQPNGQTASATESAARIALAMPFAAGRVRIGGAAGFVSSSIAGETRGAAMFDAGVQIAALPHFTFGAALRNIGSRLSGDGFDARLPSEARVGATFSSATAAGIGIQVNADFVSRLQEKTTGFAAGIEAGLFPQMAGRVGVVARAGYGDAGDAGLGQLRLGGGLSFGRINLDYTYQNLEFFGATHRAGVRIVTPR